jgi:uncharacterized protein (TIGR02466 family)
MALKLAYFQPIVLAIDNVPPVEFSQIFNLTETLHSHKELNDADNPFISIRGGQQVQVYPNKLELDVAWLVKYLETLCQGYMEVVTQQSGTDDLKLCKPVVTSIWTIRQTEGDYQEMHSHPGGSISGNIYISAPELPDDCEPSDSQLLFRLPQTRDVNKFVMTDTWKYTPTPGTVIVFPSYLPHTVYPWKGAGNRTVLAFDARLLPKDEVVQEILNGQS